MAPEWLISAARAEPVPLQWCNGNCNETIVDDETTEPPSGYGEKTEAESDNDARIQHLICLTHRSLYNKSHLARWYW